MSSKDCKTTGSALKSTEIKDGYAQGTEGNHGPSKPKVECTCCDSKSSDTSKSSKISEDKLSIDRIQNEMRLEMIFEIVMFLFKQGHWIFGGYPRDLIRFQAGVNKDAAYAGKAFSDIDAIIRAGSTDALDVEVGRLCHEFQRDPRFKSVDYVKMPSKSKYCGFTMTIVGNVGIRDLTYEIKIDFVRKTVDTRLDFDIGCLVMKDRDTFAIRRCTTDFGLKYGQVMQNILAGKFRIVGLASDASFKVLGKPEATPLEKIYDLLRMVKMTTRITNKMDCGWEPDVDSVPNGIFSHIRKAKKHCLGCTDSPDTCVRCGEIGDDLVGKWCYTLECCKKLITLDCLYHLIVEKLGKYKECGNQCRQRQKHLTLKCPSCKSTEMF